MFTNYCTGNKKVVRKMRSWSKKTQALGAMQVLWDAFFSWNLQLLSPKYFRSLDLSMKGHFLKGLQGWVTFSVTTSSGFGGSQVAIVRLVWKQCHYQNPSGFHSNCASQYGHFWSTQVTSMVLTYPIVKLVQLHIYPLVPPFLLIKPRIWTMLGSYNHKNPL